MPIGTWIPLSEQTNALEYVVKRGPGFIDRTRKQRQQFSGEALGVIKLPRPGVLDCQQRARQSAYLDAGLTPGATVVGNGLFEVALSLLFGDQSRQLQCRTPRSIRFRVCRNQLDQDR